MKSKKVNKKVKLNRVLYILGGAIAVMVILMLLMCYNPYNFALELPVGNSSAVTTSQVDPYFTHTVLPKIYNGAQLQQPFDVNVTQEGINAILTSSQWTKTANGITFNTPQVFFTPEGIVLIDHAVFNGSDFTVTIVGKPVFKKDNLMNLTLKEIKVGALPVTAIAKLIVAGCYKNAVPEIGEAQNDWPDKIATSLLNDKPFDPTFNIDGKKIRIDSVILGDQEIVIHFVPVD
jgi:hypothetical protein